MRYTVHSDSTPSPLKISQLGFSRDDEGTRFGAGQRSCYIIHYVINGSGLFNQTKLGAGQGFLIKPGQVVEYHGLASDPWEFLWILSSDAQMEDIFKRYEADEKSMIFDYGDISPARELSEYIVRNSNTIADPLELVERFLHLCNSHTKKRSAEHIKPNCEVYLDFCTSYVENNIHKKIGTADLTALLGVSQPYLYKIFQTKFGTSPKGYIIAYKMKRAKKLLRETDLTVTQIANSIGYDDVLAFSKAFKVCEQMSPKEYREKKT